MKSIALLRGWLKGAFLLSLAFGVFLRSVRRQILFASLSNKRPATYEGLEVNAPVSTYSRIYKRPSPVIFVAQFANKNLQLSSVSSA
jgi:hypothetical protein